MFPLRARKTHTPPTKPSNLEVGVEPLEQRRMLSVNVRASGTTAFITGDGSDDTVVLSGTSISGSNVTLDPSFLNQQGVIRTYKFDMRGGADTIQIQNVTGYKTVNIDGGHGDNVVFVQNSFLKQFKVVNGTGDDSTQLSNTQIGLDQNSNTGLIDIRNGDGGSDVLIESTGPGSGRSMHANKVTIINGEGTNDVTVRNIRARRTSFLISHEDGSFNTTFDNVDRIRNIKSITKSQFIGVTQLTNTRVESGSVFIQAFGRNNSGLSLFSVGGSTVARNLVHVGQDISGHRTEILSGSTVNSVRVDTRGSTGVGALVQVDGSHVKGLFQVNHRPRFLDQANNGELTTQLTDSQFDRAVNVRVKKADSGTTILDSTFAGSFNAQLDVGADVITIDDSDFLGFVRITTGRGTAFQKNDEVSIETNQFTGDTMFQKPVTINHGAGDDQVRLGGPGIFTQRVTFASSLRMDGGWGNDDLSHDVGVFFQGTVSCHKFESSTLNC